MCETKILLAGNIPKEFEIDLEEIVVIQHITLNIRKSLLKREIVNVLKKTASDFIADKELIKCHTSKKATETN